MHARVRYAQIIRMWFVTGLWSAALALSATVASAQSSHRVMLVLGTGFSPDDLAVGYTLRTQETVTADAETVVVLLKKRPINGGDCEDWVILRGNTYQAEAATPNTCVPRGDGDELGRALSGEKMIGRLTARVLFSGAPGADKPPTEVEQLRRDLSSAKSNPHSLQPSSSPQPSDAGARRVLVLSFGDQQQCLHRKKNDWQNGNPIHLWRCDDGSPDMKTWIFEKTTGYIRSSARPSMCWHKKNLDWLDGNPIHLWDCNDGELEQKAWVYDEQAKVIRSRANRSKCIQKDHAGFSNGNPVHLWECERGSADFKKWLLRAAPNQ